MVKTRIVVIACIIICTTLSISLVAAIINFTTIIQDRDSMVKVLQTNLDSTKEMNVNLTETNTMLNEAVENLTTQNEAQAQQTQILQDQVDHVIGILNMSKASQLKTLVFQVSEKGEEYESNYHLPNLDDTYQQLLTLNNGAYELLLIPEYRDNGNWTETDAWMTASNFSDKPIMLPVFAGGNKTDNTPLMQLDLNQIRQAVSTYNVQWLGIGEPISWYMEKQPTNLTSALQWVKNVIDYAKLNEIRVQLSEWKTTSNVFQLIQNCTAGYEDTVTVTFQTNSNESEPFDGFMLIKDMFPSWGGSIQSWYWDSKGYGTEKEMPVSLLVQHALLAKNMGAQMLQFEPYWYFFNNGQPTESLKILMAMLTETNPQPHLPLYQEITTLRNRITINITEPNFTNPIRQCDFYELREEDSVDKKQTTVNYWVFQNGQQEHGDIEAYVEIYNDPSKPGEYVVEVARNCWYELTIYLDGNPVKVFPRVEGNNILSPGYMTFRVTP